MELTLHDLTSFLTAPAGALSRDGLTMRLVAQNDDRLYEKEWTGTQIQRQFSIADEVKSSTPAVYLLNDQAACIAFVDESFNLQCCKYDEKEEEWNQLEGLGPFAVHPDTQLSGCFTWADQISIFFQEASGKLQQVSISLQDIADPVQCPPVTIRDISSPTVHSAFTSTGMVSHLLVIEQGEICNFKFDDANGRWELCGRLPLHGHNVTRFFVTDTEEALPLQVVALCSNNALVRFGETSQPQEFGRIEEGRFYPGTSKECGAEIATQVAKIIKGATGGQSKGTKEPGGTKETKKT